MIVNSGSEAMSGGVTSGTTSGTASNGGGVIRNSLGSATEYGQASSASVGGVLRRMLIEPSMFGMNAAASVDPEALLLQGMNVLDVLNVTIVDTEKQLTYYTHVSTIMTEACTDFASLNNNAMYIVWGCLLILIAEVVVFAYHVKSFNDWDYLIERMEIEQRLVAYEKYDECVVKEEMEMKKEAEQMVYRRNLRD